MADLKQGLENLRKNPTLKAILNVTLIIGNFLNNTSSKGFQIDYLAKIPEVKDTVHKHSLLYHLTFSVLESLPTASDLYSEIGPITRASRTDFEEVSTTLARMQEECKNSWDYLRIIAKYDDNGESESCFRNKTSEFLTDAAERIIIMGKVHKRIMQRFHDFLQWLGVPKHLHNDYRAHQICKIISEFSLEFRTTRERVQQTIAKKREAKERNKSRQKLHELMMRQEEGGRRRREDKEVDDLSLMLKRDGDGTIPRRKKKHRPREENGERRRRRPEDGEGGEEKRRGHRRRKAEEAEGTEGEEEVRPRRRAEEGRPVAENGDEALLEDLEKRRRRREVKEEDIEKRRRRRKEKEERVVSPNSEQYQTAEEQSIEAP